MDDFVEVPPGKSLLEMLEEKHQMPVTILRYPCCASCLKPFTVRRRPYVELHAAPAGLRFPILYLCELCEDCRDDSRAGGRRKRAVLAAVREFVAKEESGS